MTILSVDGLTKSFGGLTAVDGVSFSITKGEILGIIGPNGAGKSTVFNLIAGFIRPDQGRVIFSGEDITGLAVHRIAAKGLCKTFQLVKPFSTMTVEENCMVPLLRQGEAFRDAQRRVFNLLDRFRLLEFAQMLPGELPYALRRRLEIVRAYAARPQLLLLDEALAGLTAKELAEMLTLLREIRSDGTTQLMIEHVMDATMQLCDRIVVLDQGRVIAAGKPAEVVEEAAVIEAYLGRGD